MPSFGPESRGQLATCDERLQEICNAVIINYDFSVLEGFRSNDRQAELLRQNKTTKAPGESWHNTSPSLAVDLAPYPIDWENHKRFYLLAGFMFQAAKERGLAIIWGGDWDGDWIHTDQTFHDLPHYQIMVK